MEIKKKGVENYDYINENDKKIYILKNDSKIQKILVPVQESSFFSVVLRYSTTMNHQIPNLQPTIPRRNKTIQKKKSISSSRTRTSSTRISAAKKYPGQVMTGFAYFVLNKLAESQDPIDRQVVKEVQNVLLGKFKEEYKMSSVKKIKDFIFVYNGDIQDPVKSNIKDLLREFFKDENYTYWLKNQFHGNIESKVWLSSNKNTIMQRIFNDVKNKFIHSKTQDLSKKREF